MHQYHKALTKELIEFAQTSGKLHLETIFFGGGTPSTYPESLLLDMFGTLRKMFEFDSNAEVTIEVNPGTVKSEHLKVWKTVGINRLSIGVQSLKDSVLKSLNRHQSAAQVTELLQAANPLFDNISIDLILGMPDVSELEWKELINTVMQWPIKHISIYFLTIHENTPLYFKVQQHKVTVPEDDYVIDLYHWTRERLAMHGFEQYELSNFAIAGYESRHNTVYWERKPYKGIGLGACSFDGEKRFQNEKNLIKYMSSLEKNESITLSCEVLNDEQIRLEKLMLGLRRRKGVAYQELLEHFSTQEKNVFDSTIKNLIDHNFLIESNGRLMLTAQGLLIENQIIVQLMRTN